MKTLVGLGVMPQPGSVCFGAQTALSGLDTHLNLLVRRVHHYLDRWSLNALRCVVEGKGGI